MKNILVIIGIISISASLSAQTTNTTFKDFQSKFNVITTTVPFLQISPDARAGGMADAGVAVSPDAHSVYWNAAKLSFAEQKSAFGMSGAPWLKTLVPDIWLYYLSGYKKIDEKSAWGASMRYFSLGNIQFTDINNQSLGNFTPSEFSFDGCYSRKLSENFSVGVNLKFIMSNLAGRTVLQGGQQAKSGLAGAGDISFYYKKPHKINGQDAHFAWGMNITNIGNKITYTNSSIRDFIPINLRTGVYEKIVLDEHNDIGFTLEFSKLLVPTPPKRDNNGKIISGMDNNVSVGQGMFQSFYDAPGGSKEELREVIYQLGMEYWYEKQFAGRFGFFHESPFKGNRRYFTLGLGMRYKVFGLDFAYLVPLLQRNPLENTLRFSVQFNFDKVQSK
jgi:hypothetical protein